MRFSLKEIIYNENALYILNNYCNIYQKVLEPFIEETKKLLIQIQLMLFK